MFMAKLLLRTESAVEDCEKHLKTSGGFGTEIESYLTQYLLVVLCADIQQEIYRLSEARASIVKDEAISAYVAATARKIMRSVGKSDIANFVGMFGATPRSKLNGLIDDADVTIFNNAVNCRHDIAHKHGAQISFNELKNAIAVAQKILGAVEHSLVNDDAVIRS